jgi:NitT/TauT family transport system ATP-binding protein
MDGHEGGLNLVGVSKVFTKDKREIVAVNGFSLSIKPQEFVCILGPSGCGKTTILRMIAGLDTPTSGSISLNGNIVKEPGRDRGMVFQEFALFPWRTVRKNIEFGPELSNMPPEKIREISDRFIELVGLKTFEDIHPKELSGGMKQRVGIARALANDPSILLMDEPFGSIDAQTRNLMQKELLRIWQTTKKTVMFVTHSVEEAVFLADKIIIMTARPGKVREIIEVPLARPRDRTSQEFIKIRARVLAELEEEFEKTQALEKAREK